MKNNLLITSLIAAVCLALQPVDGQAQNGRNPFVPYSEVGLGLGTASYYGEIAGYRKPLKSTFIMMRWNAAAMYTRHFTPKLAARASFTWARIAGDDYTYNRKDLNSGIVQYARNLHFRNDLKEFALTGIYQFVPDGRNPNYRAKLTPYIFVGLAAVAHSPEARTPVGFGTTPDDTEQRWVKLQPLGTEGQGQNGVKPYSLMTLAIPVGFGVRYRLNDRFGLSGEINYRFTSTDYLDDVGGAYPDPTILKDDLARVMADRRLEPTAARKGGDRVAELQKYLNTSDPLSVLASDPNYGTRGANGVFNDGYMTISFQVHYVLTPRIKCPPIK
ncbi:hypothetical protein GCM10028803_38970 [Larkinella knui]|uniref:DUF6089 domain-containing protein n=1 Tax=Larkinella knui TaxID=2025310 RepID=A0A3P1CEH7_9BACT|nr:DUF6089 family protein [Larkinella knui]RRB11741.1 hypothetical protein EHT87_25065 [Larkinella knui]